MQMDKDHVVSGPTARFLEQDEEGYHYLEVLYKMETPEGQGVITGYKQGLIIKFRREDLFVCDHGSPFAILDIGYREQQGQPIQQTPHVPNTL